MDRDSEHDEIKRTEEATVTDVTRGNLLTSLIKLAWPSVLQAVLSNCYAFNDFMFVGRISDKAESSAATAALAATVGLQVIMFAFHNCVPSGANTFTAQNRGAKDFQRLAVIFKSAVLACFFVSSLMATVGYTQIRHISSLVNAEPRVEAAISDFFGLSFLGAPAFGFLLLIDGFFKSNGDTRTPLGLEIASLIINTALNYVLILHFNWGIKGAAIATIISKCIPALVGLYKILRGDLGFDIPLLTSHEDIKIMLRCATDMIKIGVFESIAYLIYGFVFTLLIRLSGQLGYAQQAGLGAGMRGLEWIAFCLSEGFLVAACSSVGQCIGAKMYRRAMMAAISCSTMSAMSAFATGLPFVFFPVQIASILSKDTEIVKYCAEYIYILGYVMFFVGWEMASFGALLGAGKANFLCWVNGSLNLARIPIAILCMYDSKDFWVVLKWTIGFSHSIDDVSPTGGFSCVCYSVAATAVFKALFFMCSFMYRYFTGLNFTDCNLIEKNSATLVDFGTKSSNFQKSSSAASANDYLPVQVLDESHRGLIELSTIVIAGSEEFPSEVLEVRGADAVEMNNS